jgi:hypothetical protein
MVNDMYVFVVLCLVDGGRGVQRSAVDATGWKMTRGASQRDATRRAHFVRPPLRPSAG